MSTFSARIVEQHERRDDEDRRIAVDLYAAVPGRAPYYAGRVHFDDELDAETFIGTIQMQVGTGINNTGPTSPTPWE